MTDHHTIESAYDRLASSLDAPRDADRLVAARVASRRRRRRTTQGLALTLSTVVVGGAIALASSGGGQASPSPAPSFAADTTTAAGEPTEVTATASTPAGLEGCTAPVPPAPSNDVFLPLDVVRLLNRIDDPQVTDQRVVLDDGETTVLLLQEDGAVRYVVDVVTRANGTHALRRLGCP